MSVRQVPPTRVPTLTEVVRLPEAEAPAGVVEPAPEEPAPVPARVPAAAAAPAGPERRAAAAPAIDGGELVERVFAHLQRQIDLMLEVMLREVLTPALTRATDALMRESRAELASTLRDMVARAVAQELSRHRGR